MSDLSSGASALAGGTSELANGTQGIADGSSQLASGAQELATGAAEFSTGVGELAGGISLLAYGDGGANPGLQGLATGASTYASGVDAGIGGVQDGAAQTVAGLQGLQALLASSSLTPAELAAVNAILDPTIAGQQAIVDSTDLAQLRDGGYAIADGIELAAGGAGELATGADQLASGASELAGGVAGVADGANGLASGAAQVSAGTTDLATGANQLADGTSQLAAGTPELAEGAEGIAEGVSGLTDGVSGLADGLSEASAQVPSYSEKETTNIAETATQQVEVSGESDALFNDSGVPLFAGVALWAGALAAFLLLAPLWRRAQEAARSVGYITLRSILPALGLGAVQGVLAGVILPMVLSYSFEQGFAFFWLALAAGVSFTLVVQGFSALFGGYGRFAAFAVLVLALATGIVSTAPGVLNALAGVTPVSAAMHGFQSIAADGLSGAWGQNALLLMLWGVFGILLTWFAVRRARRQTVGELRGVALA